MPSNYKPAIPQPDDIINSKVQPDMLNNFQAINSWVNQNHTPLTTATITQGMHNLVSFPTQTGVPTFIGNPESWDMFSMLSARTGVPELFLQRTGSPSINYGATEFNNSGFGPGQVGVGANGWTRLPSGLIMLWFAFNLAAVNTIATITFSKITFTAPQPPPFTAPPFSITAHSPGNVKNLVIPQIGTITATNFTVFPTNPANSTFQPNLSFLVIGSANE